MKKMLFVVALVTALACFASAGSMPAVHLGNSPHVSGHQVHANAALFFCPAKTCLYYAGDIDSTNTSNENALFDIDNPGIGITDAEVWVGVKPKKAATISGTSENFATTATAIGVNPTPFMTQTGITAGKAGKLVCNTTGTTSYKAYAGANNSFGLNGINYYAKKLKKACKMAKAGKATYVLFNPQYNDSSTIGYLEDVEDAKPANHKGWKNDVDDSYFNSSSFGVTYELTSGSSGACGGIGCDEFSLSLSGK